LCLKEAKVLNLLEMMSHLGYHSYSSCVLLALEWRINIYIKGTYVLNNVICTAKEKYFEVVTDMKLNNKF
jgi:hypothetical protein